MSVKVNSYTFVSLFLCKRVTRVCAFTHIHRSTDPSASARHGESLDMGLDDVDFILSTTGWMDLLTCDDSTSMPSHLVNPLGSSLLRHVPNTNHASIDVATELNEAQKI